MKTCDTRGNGRSKARESNRHRPLKKFLKKLSKMLDNFFLLCYNIGTKNKRGVTYEI